MSKNLSLQEAISIILEVLESKNFEELDLFTLKKVLQEINKNSYPKYRTRGEFLENLKVIIHKNTKDSTSKINEYDILNWIEPLFTETKPPNKFLKNFNPYQPFIATTVSLIALFVAIFKK